MYNLIASILYFIVSFVGTPIPGNGHVDLCRRTSIDNLDYALYIPINDSWLLHFKFDDSNTVVYVVDSCEDWYTASEISASGIEHVDF